MINKRMGTKIMAVLLAAAMALPSSGTAFAAERVPAETAGEDVNGDSEKPLWDMLRSAFSENGGVKGTNTTTNTGTDTDTNTGISEEEVTLQVAAAEEIFYGDSLKEKITVTAVKKGETTPIEGFSDYVLQYYDENHSELDAEPKDAGTYFVKAFVNEKSDTYTGEPSEEAKLTIAPKRITVKPKDKTIDVKDGLPEYYEAELTEESELAYDEKLMEGKPTVVCGIWKDDELVSADALEMGTYTLKVEHVELGLADGAKAENYQVETAYGRLTVAEMLTLTVTGENSFVYGDIDDSEFTVEAFDRDENPEELAEERLFLTYYDADGQELDGMPRAVGRYFVKAVYTVDEEQEDYKAGESEKFPFEITKREIGISLESIDISNGADAPSEEELTQKLNITGLIVTEPEEEGKLPYNDEWEIPPRAYYTDGMPDTKVAGSYGITVEGTIAEEQASNYEVKCDNATLTVGVPEGEEKLELNLTLEDVSAVYGDDIKSAVAAGIKAVMEDGTEITEQLAADKFTLQCFDSEGNELETIPSNAGSYKVKAVYAEDVAYKEAVSNEAELTITKRELTVTAKTYGIANGAELPKLGAEAVAVEGTLASGDEWKTYPSAEYADTDIDTKTAGTYVIKAVAEVTESNKDNYAIELVDGSLYVAEKNAETGKSKAELRLAEGASTSKIYDGEAFVMTKDSVVDKYGYKGELEFIWPTADGTAPKDAGRYNLTIKIPDSVEDWEGSLAVEITIDPKPVTAQAQPRATETVAGEPVKCDVSSEGFIAGDKWVKEPVVKVVAGDVNAPGSYQVQAAGGEAGRNYVIAGYGDPVTVTVKDANKPIINSVKFGKKDTYSAVYTGEQIRPTMTVACTYLNDKGKTATQKLKLNVDYTVSYFENVNAGTAEVTVTGIGEYAGVITKEFTITKKSMKKVTLSSVGDIKVGEKPALVVMDGSYQLSEDDYEILVKKDKNSAFEPLENITCGANDVLEKVELKVQAKADSNYDGESSKKVKFNILGADVNAIPIADITFDINCLKIPTKGYTYNGKAQKPKVTVTGKDGKKLKTSEYKVVYSNNVNAGVDVAEVRIVGLYNKKKGTGYYGVSAPVTFTIGQKSFKKVSVSSVAAIPKSGRLDSITITVKDGKRILTENVDYITDYSSIVDDNGRIMSDRITIGQKYPVKLTALPGGNYLEESKDINIKFGQLNLASKTAKVNVSLSSAEASGVTVIYNGVTLVQNTDYTVTKIKQDRRTGTYTVTIKAVKGKQCVYKGSRTIKNLTVQQDTNS